MTMTPSSTVTTTQIRHEGRTGLLTSFDFTSTDILTRTYLPKLQSLLAPVIEQWWNSLSRSQRSAVVAQKLSLKISASCLHQSLRPALSPSEPQQEGFPLLPVGEC